jgi:hypothetical protein
MPGTASRPPAAAHHVVAVGSRRHDWLDRALLGSVITELARDGRHSLLVVPPPAVRLLALDVVATGAC